VHATLERSQSYLRRIPVRDLCVPAECFTEIRSDRLQIVRIRSYVFNNMAGTERCESASSNRSELRRSVPGTLDGVDEERYGVVVAGDLAQMPELAIEMLAAVECRIGVAYGTCVRAIHSSRLERFRGPAASSREQSPCLVTLVLEVVVARQASREPLRRGLVVTRRSRHEPIANRRTGKQRFNNHDFRLLSRSVCPAEPLWTDYVSAFGALLGVFVAGVALLVAVRSARDARRSAESADRTSRAAETSAEASRSTLEAATGQLELARAAHERAEAEGALRPSVESVELSEIRPQEGELAPLGTFRVGFKNSGDKVLAGALLTILVDPAAGAQLGNRWGTTTKQLPDDDTIER
jgi:hypothetical protein